MDGIININKPIGMTSFGVVARVKRLCRERRVGHAGTLDPLASGVLPVCIGKATRVIEYLLETRKTYRAAIEFGVITDTGDAAGSIIERTDASGVTRGTVAAALIDFRGTVSQTPPMFSALKYRGVPLYALARAGISVDRGSRTVEIYGLELIDWESPVASIEVTCSRGTYVRTLAEDIGKAVGCGASLKSLVRLRYGPFDIRDSVSLEDLQGAFDDGDPAVYLCPPDIVLQHWPFTVVNPELAERIRHGRPVPSDMIGEIIEPSVPVESKTRVRACTLDGSFLGVLRFNSEKKEWQPEKVFS